MDDAGFAQLWGRWESLDLDHVRELMAGFDRPWWIAGGHAIEAFTGVCRSHEDVDVAFFRSDLPRLREHLQDDWHMWSVGSGLMRPITDEYPDLHPESGQVWLRQHALAPWVLDLLASPGDLTAYKVRFYDAFHAPLEDVTWTDDAGTRWLNPEVVLGFKSRHRRAKDEADLQAALPLLDERGTRRLRLLVRHVDPEHPWLQRL